MSQQKRKIEESSDESSEEEVQEKKIKEAETKEAETKKIKSNWMIKEYERVKRVRQAKIDNFNRRLPFLSQREKDMKDVLCELDSYSVSLLDVMSDRKPVTNWHWTEAIPSVRTGLWWEDWKGDCAWRVIKGCEGLDSKPVLGATEEETEANYRKWAQQAEPVVRRLADDYPPGAADKIKTALQCLPDLREYMRNHPFLSEPANWR